MPRENNQSLFTEGEKIDEPRTQLQINETYVRNTQLCTPRAFVHNREISQKSDNKNKYRKRFNPRQIHFSLSPDTFFIKFFRYSLFDDYLSRNICD